MSSSASNALLEQKETTQFDETTVLLEDGNVYTM
jgi:hypothetical protein